MIVSKPFEAILGSRALCISLASGKHSCLLPLTVARRANGLDAGSEWMVGKPEVILRRDLFGSGCQRLFILRRIIGNDPRPKRPKTLFRHSESLQLGGRERGLTLGVLFRSTRVFPIRTERCPCHCFITLNLRDSVTFRAFAKRHTWRNRKCWRRGRYFRRRNKF